MLKVDILAAPETTGSVLYGIYDILKLTGAAWSRVVLGATANPITRVRIVSREDRLFQCRGEIPVTPHLSIADANDADVICIPSMHIPVDENPHGWFREEVGWLLKRYEAGSTIAAVCSGSLLLAEAGLLDGQQATAHWAFEPMFRKYYPQIDFRPERTLSNAGTGNRLILAGGMSSYQDLALHLVARFLGPEHAVQSAKFFLISGHDDGLLPYVTLSRRTQKSDQAISECQKWLAENYAKDHAISQMLELSGLNRRTFSRRFKAATGYSPIEYVQALRIEEAKQMLEASHLPVEEIAEAVGYGDEGAFRRIFVKRSGISPSAYRKKFGHARFRFPN